MRAAVIGCGIAGASVALALAEIGLDVEVHEAAPRSRDHQGWVTLGPSAMTGLARVGVGDEVWAAGFPVVSVHMVDTVTGKVADFPRYEATHRYPSTHVWRRDLLSILRGRLDAAGITCYYGSSATAGDLDADLIVGADGAWSATRRVVGNRTEPTYTGQIIRYGHHPRHAAGLPTGVLHFWRHRDGVVGYVGDDGDGSFWFSRYNSDNPSLTVDLDTMTAVLRDTPVREVLGASSWVSSPIALYDLDPNGVWYHQHTVVIGDAAHALSPAAGRGATSAIEDAIILAKTLREHAYGVVPALEAFTANRHPIARATYRPVPGQRPVASSADELELPTCKPKPLR